MDLDWSAQISYMEQQVCFISNRLSSARLSAPQIIAGINEVLTPKLEYGMRYVHLPKSKLESWNRRIRRTVTAAQGFTRPISLIADSAFAVFGGVTDLSAHTCMVSGSELLFRLNSSKQHALSSRLRFAAALKKTKVKTR